MLKAFVVTYAGFATADFLSDRLLQPGKKLDYGFVNKFLGRKVGSSFMGTRLEHHLVLPAYMAGTAVLGGKFWGAFAQKRGKTFGIGTTPLMYMGHLFTFVHLSISMFYVHCALTNPDIKDKTEFLKEGIWGNTKGSLSMVAFPYYANVLAKFGGALPALGWIFNNAIAGTIAYYHVKATGWDSFRKDALSDLEKEFNGMLKDDEL